MMLQSGSKKQGYVDAMGELGEYYFNKKCNYPMAGHWFEMAAKKGNKEAEKILNEYFYWDSRHEMWWKRS